MPVSPLRPHPALPADTLRVVEIHYYRVPRERWELMILRARQSGANGVSTYIPWVHHEPSAGALDLDGSTLPERDLVGFVQLCVDAGLGFVAKPGPFCDSEMIGGGVPTWLLEAHPDWWAIRHDGQPYGHGDSNDPRLSYAHPAAQSACGEWLRAVATALEPFAPPTHRPIHLNLERVSGPETAERSRLGVRAGLWAIQIDNETPGDGMWIHEDATAASPIRADFCGRELPPPWTPPTTVDELRPWIGLDRLADEQMASGLAAYASAIRAVLGDRVPLFHDWQCMPWQLSGMLIEPGALADTCGWVGQNVYAEGVDPEHMIAGTNWYKMNDAEYLHHAWWRTRLCRTLSTSATGYTMPNLVPEISARQAFYLQCSLIGGMDAPCIYMLHSSEPEPEGIGAFQRWAEEAPVLPDGTVLEWWWNIRCLFLCLEAGGADLVESPLTAPVAIAYDHAGERLARWAGVIEGGGFPEGSELGELCAGSNTSAAGMLIVDTLVSSGIEFDVVDVTRSPLDGYGLVIVPDTRVMSRAAINALNEVPVGQILWCGTPTHDEDLTPLELQRDPTSVTSDPHAPAFLAARVADSTIDNGADLDGSTRVGQTGRRYVTVVNRSGGRVEATAAGVALATNPASVTWFALDGERVVAAMLHGDDAKVGDLECSQGQCAIALFPSDGTDDAWHVISQERAWITVPEAAGRQVWRLTLAGKVIDAGIVAPDGRFRFIHQDDRGQTDRYVLGDRSAADAVTTPVGHFFDTTLTRAEADANALGIESWEIVERIRRTRSRMVAGTASDDEVTLLPDLTRIAARMNDIRLGES